MVPLRASILTSRLAAVLLACFLVFELGCAATHSQQKPVPAEQRVGFASLEERATVGDKQQDEPNRWETAATAVLFLLVVIGSAAVPVLLLL
ncbi:MAG: hypothetical protein N3C12_02640 [Candidatus Binatia bacterium]|nr:hypothetical protein [Candidatus Binatia bacterium]